MCTGYGVSSGGGEGCGDVDGSEEGEGSGPCRVEIAVAADVYSMAPFVFQDVQYVMVGNSSGKTDACDHLSDPGIVASMLGNSVAFVCKSYGGEASICCWVVALGMVQFKLGQGEELVYLASPVGSNDVPAPVLVTTKGFFFVNEDYDQEERLRWANRSAVPAAMQGCAPSSLHEWEVIGYEVFMEEPGKFGDVAVPSSKWLLFHM